MRKGWNLRSTSGQSQRSQSPALTPPQKALGMGLSNDEIHSPVTNLAKCCTFHRRYWLEAFLIPGRLYIYTNIHTYIHPYIHTSIHPYIHTSIHPYIHTSIHPYIHTYIHTYLLTYILPYLHTYYTYYTYYTYLHTAQTQRQTSIQIVIHDSYYYQLQRIWNLYHIQYSLLRLGLTIQASRGIHFLRDSQ